MQGFQYIYKHLLHFTKVRKKLFNEFAEQVEKAAKMTSISPYPFTMINSTIFHASVLDFPILSVLNVAAMTYFLLFSHFFLNRLIVLFCCFLRVCFFLSNVFYFVCLFCFVFLTDLIFFTVFRFDLIFCV